MVENVDEDMDYDSSDGEDDENEDEIDHPVEMRWMGSIIDENGVRKSTQARHITVVVPLISEVYISYNRLVACLRRFTDTVLINNTAHISHFYRVVYFILILIILVITTIIVHILINILDHYSLRGTLLGSNN